MKNKKRIWGMGGTMTREKITKEDVWELYKRNVMSALELKISIDDNLYDSERDNTLDEIGETLNFNYGEDNYPDTPPELKWIEDVLEEPIDDSPIIIWKSDIEKYKKIEGATLEDFFTSINN